MARSAGTPLRCRGATATSRHSPRQSPSAPGLGIPFHETHRWRDLWSRSSSRRGHRMRITFRPMGPAPEPPPPEKVLTPERMAGLADRLKEAMAAIEKWGIHLDPVSRLKEAEYLLRDVASTLFRTTCASARLPPPGGLRRVPCKEARRSCFRSPPSVPEHLRPAAPPPGVADDGLPSVLRIVECSRIRAIGWIAITDRTEPNPGRQTDAAVSSSSRSRMSAPPRGPAEAAETARHEERGHGRTYRIEDRSTWQWQARGGLERLRSTRPSDAI